MIKNDHFTLFFSYQIASYINSISSMVDFMIIKILINLIAIIIMLIIIIIIASPSISRLILIFLSQGLPQRLKVSRFEILQFRYIVSSDKEKYLHYLFTIFIQRSSNIFSDQHSNCLIILNIKFQHTHMQKQTTNPAIQMPTSQLTVQNSNTVKLSSYGIQIPSKEQLKSIKKKVQLLKEAIIKERAERVIVEQEFKNLQQKYFITEQNLQKKEEKNQNLLHESRQLKDILIRQKQEIKALEAEIEAMKEKKKKKTSTSLNSNNSEAQPQNQGWTNYLTSFWK